MYNPSAFVYPSHSRRAPRPVWSGSQAKLITENRTNDTYAAFTHIGCHRRPGADWSCRHRGRGTQSRDRNERRRPLYHRDPTLQPHHPGSGRTEPEPDRRKSEPVSECRFLLLLWADDLRTDLVSGRSLLGRDSFHSNREHHRPAN